MLRKLFPALVGNTPDGSFKLVFVSEGFTASQQQAFSTACVQFTQRLLRTTPFNLTVINPGWISIYTLFKPSEQSGPVVGVPVAGRTAFESAVDPTTFALSLNVDRVNTVLSSEKLRFQGEELPLTRFLAVGRTNFGATGTLIVFLIPSTAPIPLGAEVEHISADPDFHFVSTTLDGEWHQVVLRALGSLFGLGDEFEQAGDDFQSPRSAIQQQSWYFNLEFAENPPLTNDGFPKWRSLFRPAALSQPAIVHSKVGGATMPDLTLEHTAHTAEEAQFWEGGGGYRSKVYRTAADCLMRRRVGDLALPVRSREVPFCLACRAVLQTFVR